MDNTERRGECVFDYLMMKNKKVGPLLLSSSTGTLALYPVLYQDYTL